MSTYFFTLRRCARLTRTTFIICTAVIVCAFVIGARVRLVDAGTVPLTTETALTENRVATRTLQQSGVDEAVALLNIAGSIERASISTLAESDQESAATQTHTRSTDRLDVLQLTLRPTGFQPSEVTQSNKRFLLRVQNASTLPEVNLRLTKENGEREREIPIGRGMRKWREILKLQPGRYMLSEADHPEWRCIIIVTND